MTKKFLALVMVVSVLGVFLVGCGSKSDDASGGSTATTASTAGAAATGTTAGGTATTGGDASK